MSARTPARSRQQLMSPKSTASAGGWRCVRHRYCGEHARIVDPREDTEPDAGSYLFFHAFIRGVPIDEIAIFISSAMRRRPARPVVNPPPTPSRPETQS